MNNLALDLTFSEPAIQAADVPVSALKADLENKLRIFSLAFDRFEGAYKELSELVRLNSYSLNVLTLLEEFTNAWIQQQCDAATALISDYPGHLSITPEMLDSSVASFSFPRRSHFFGDAPELKNGKSIFDATVSELTTYIVENFDSDLLEREIEKATKLLNQTSFSDAAKKLASLFGFTRYHDYEGKKLVIKRQKGKLILPSHYYRTTMAYERMRRWNELAVVARTFENETGEKGLSDVFEFLIHAEDRTSRFGSSGIAGGTRLNEDGAVSAIIFKEKINFCFKPELLESLYAFLKAYSSVHVVALEIEQ